MFARNAQQKTVSPYDLAKKIARQANSPALGYCYLVLVEKLGNKTLPLTREMLGEMFHVHPRTAARYMDKLSSMGYVIKTITRRGNRNLPNLYSLTYQSTDKLLGQPAESIQFNGQIAPTRGTKSSAMMNDDDDIHTDKNKNSFMSQNPNREALKAIGVHAPVCDQFDHIPHETVAHWCNHAQQNDAIQNPAAFVVSKLKQNATPTPKRPTTPRGTKSIQRFNGESMRDYSGTDAAWIET